MSPAKAPVRTADFSILGRPNIATPRIIKVGKNLSYIGAVRDLRQEKHLPEYCERRASQYMNTIVGQDHRFMKRLIRPGLGIGSYPTAWRTIQGYEMTHMIRKDQIEGIDKGNIGAQNRFIGELCGLVP